MVHQAMGMWYPLSDQGKISHKDTTATVERDLWVRGQGLPALILEDAYFHLYRPSTLIHEDVARRARREAYMVQLLDALRLWNTDK